MSSYHIADFKLVTVASIPNDVAPPIVLDEFQASFQSCLKNLLAAKDDTVEYVYYRGVDGPSVWSILCQLVHLNVVLLHAKKGLLQTPIRLVGWSGCVIIYLDLQCNLQ